VVTSKLIEFIVTETKGILYM